MPKGLPQDIVCLDGKDRHQGAIRPVPGEAPTMDVDANASPLLKRLPSRTGTGGVSGAFGKMGSHLPAERCAAIFTLMASDWRRFVHGPTGLLR
jgi:hypothetical protein